MSPEQSARDSNFKPRIQGNCWSASTAAAVAAVAERLREESKDTPVVRERVRDAIAIPSERTKGGKRKKRG